MALVSKGGGNSLAVNDMSGLTALPAWGGVIPPVVPIAVLGAGNLLTDPRQLDIPDWTIYGTVTNNGLTAAAGPDNVLPARKLAFPASSGSDANVLYNFANALQTGTHVASVWLRVAAGTADVYLHLMNGSVTVVSSIRCAVTTTWQQFQTTASFVAFVDNIYVEIGFDGTIGVFPPIAACNVEAAYAQLEFGSVAPIG